MRQPNRFCSLFLVPAILTLAVTGPEAFAQKRTPRKTPPAAQKPKSAAKSKTPGTAAPAAKNSLNLKFIPASPLAAVIVHPAPILAAPQFQSMPIEILEAAALQEAGIDISKVEEVVLLVAFNPAQPQPPLPAWIVRFSEACDQTAIAEHLSTGPGEKIGGLESYLVKDADPLSIVFPDDRTMLVATAAELSDMLSAKDAKSPLLDHLRTVDGSESLSAVVVLDPIRPIIQGALSQLPPLPPQYQPFTAAPDLLSAIEFHLRLGENAETFLVLEGTGQGAAAKLDLLLDNAIELGRAALDGEVARLGAENPGPVGEATGRYLKRLMNTTLAAIERQQARNRLTLRMKGNADATVALATNGVLVALLLPAVQSARTAARRAQSNNNLKQIGLAMQVHADVYKRFPARAIFEDGKPLLSWRVAVLPFIEQKALYDQFHLDEPWDSEHNRQLIEKMPPVYANPKLEAKLVAAGRTNYLVPTGPGTLFDGEESETFATIKDGTSNTLIAVEANADRAVIWTKPDDLEIDPDNPLVGLGDFQAGGFMVLFADGHTSFLKKTIDGQTLWHLFTANGGEPVNVD
jgi:prepilin-type processing-associated H-X9-DG protein